MTKQIRTLVKASETTDRAKRLRVLEELAAEVRHEQDQVLAQMTPTAIAKVLGITKQAGSYRRQHANRRLHP